jgi:hypothetical protein
VQNRAGWRCRAEREAARRRALEARARRTRNFPGIIRPTCRIFGASGRGNAVCGDFAAVPSSPIDPCVLSGDRFATRMVSTSTT